MDLRDLIVTTDGGSGNDGGGDPRDSVLSLSLGGGDSLGLSGRSRHDRDSASTPQPGLSPDEERADPYDYEDTYYDYDYAGAGDFRTTYAARAGGTDDAEMGGKLATLDSRGSDMSLMGDKAEMGSSFGPVRYDAPYASAGAGGRAGPGPGSGARSREGDASQHERTHTMSSSQDSGAQGGMHDDDEEEELLSPRLGSNARLGSDKKGRERSRSRDRERDRERDRSRKRMGMSSKGR